MVWFVVDDKFHGSEEVMSIPRERRLEAIGLWSLAGAWSSDHLKDGFVPLYLLDQFGASVELANLLVNPAKLWTKTRRGYQFRNWPKWQKTRAEVDAARQRERDRKATYRARSQENTGAGPADVPVGQNRIPDTPIPIPIPTSLTTDINVSPVLNTGLDLGRIIATVMSECGRECSERVALMIAGEVLYKSTSPVPRKTAYVVKAIRNEPFVWQQFVDEHGDAA